MSAQARLHLVGNNLVDENGEIVPREVAAQREEFDKAKTDLKMAQRDVMTKNRRIAELEADKALSRMNYERRADVERIATYWHRRCRNGSRRVNPMSPDRFDAVRGILEQTVTTFEDPPPGSKRKRKIRHERPMYSMAECKAAIDGAHFDHFVKKRKNGSEQHYDDLELIFRDSGKFEEFRDRCPYPIELAQRAVTRDTSAQGSNPGGSPATDGKTGVHHGRFVGVTDHGFAGPVQAGRLHLRACPRARTTAQPAIP